MKHYKVRSLFVMMLLVFSIPIISLANTQTCFVNPDGGEYYHSRPNCERIAEKYWSSMIEIPMSQLSEGQYAALAQCAWCYGLNQTPLPSDDPYHAYYKSPYDTAEDIEINEAGHYRVGDTLLPGIYTAWADEHCNGALQISDALGQVIHTYTIQGATSYSFYVDEGMEVSIPAHISLRKFHHHVGFQQANESIPSYRRDILPWMSVPGLSIT